MLPDIEVGAVRADEIDSVLEGIDAAFSPAEGPIRRQAFVDILPFEPLASLEYLRVVRVQGKVIAAVILIPLFLQVGKSYLKAAGLTGVATWHGHRHKGYASRLLEDVHSFLEGRGFDITILNSAASQLYLQHGYETSHQAFTLSLPWQVAAKIATQLGITEKFSIRQASSGDVQAMHKIYTSNPVTAARKLQFIRTLQRFQDKFAFFSNRGDKFWVVEETGKAGIQAYAWQNGSTLPDVFSQRDDPNHYLALIRHVVLTIDRETYPEAITLCPLPEHKRLIALVRSFGGSFIEGAMSPKMACILSVDRMLQKMLPEWEWALKSAGKQILNCQFTLKIASQFYKITCSRNHLDIIPHENAIPESPIFPLSPQELTLLLFGLTSPEELIGDQELYHGDEIRRILLEVIFPIRKPFILPLNDY